MLYLPDTQPTQPLTTTACQPFSAVATHSKVSPFLAAVMRLYCVPLPVRMLTVPLTQEIEQARAAIRAAVLAQGLRFDEEEETEKGSE